MRFSLSLSFSRFFSLLFHLSPRLSLFALMSPPHHPLSRSPLSLSTPSSTRDPFSFPFATQPPSLSRSLFLISHSAVRCCHLLLAGTKRFYEMQLAPSGDYDFMTTMIATRKAGNGCRYCDRSVIRAIGCIKFAHIKTQF